LKGVNLPKEKLLKNHKNTKIRNIFVFLFFLNFPFIISIVFDIILFIVLGKYGLIFFSFICLYYSAKIKILFNK
jgi:hypothetical protein